jgi:hypothetical protein
VGSSRTRQEPTGCRSPLERDSRGPAIRGVYLPTSPKCFVKTRLIAGKSESGAAVSNSIMAWRTCRGPVFLQRLDCLVEPGPRESAARVPERFLPFVGSCAIGSKFFPALILSLVWLHLAPGLLIGQHEHFTCAHAAPWSSLNVARRPCRERPSRSTDQASESRTNSGGRCSRQSASVCGRACDEKTSPLDSARMTCICVPGG